MHHYLQDVGSLGTGVRLPDCSCLRGTWKRVEVPKLKEGGAEVVLENWSLQLRVQVLGLVLRV